MGLTKAQLEALNISSFPDNTSELITPEILRTYNSASIANTVNQDTYTTDSASFDSRINGIVVGTGFATTGSNTFTGNQTINADLIVSQSKLIRIGTNQSIGTPLGNLLVIESQGGNLIRNTAGGGDISIQNTQGNVFISGSSTRIQEVDFIPFSSSLNSRINSITGSTINTGSFATTGSNTFNGNQIINGAVSISSSAAYDLDITGAFQATVLSRVSSSLGVASLSGTGFIYTSNTSSIQSNVQKGIVNSLDSTNAPTDFRYIGISGNPSTSGPASLSTITNPSIITPSSSVLGFIAPIQFQHRSNYTDGRVTFTTPLSASAGFTASLQEGFVWVGNSLGQNTQVATSSFGTTINTASFATTGSNTFTGQQTIQPTGGSALSIVSSSINFGGLGSRINFPNGGYFLGNPGDAMLFATDGAGQEFQAGDTTPTSQSRAINFRNTSPNGNIQLLSQNGGQVILSGSTTSIQNVEFIPFSASLNTRINSITTINTGSFATTGSNTFTGSQFISGGVKITGYIQTGPNQYSLETSDGIRVNKIISTSGLNISGSNTTEALNSFYPQTLWQHAGIVRFGNQIGGVGSGSIFITADGGAALNLSGSQTNLAGVDFIPFSASVNSRILAITGSGGSNVGLITTGSYTSSIQAISGGFAFDTRYPTSNPYTSNLSIANTIGVPYSVLFNGSTTSNQLNYWVENNFFTGTNRVVIASGSGITNGTVNGYNFTSNELEIYINSGTITSGSSYTLTGPALSTISVTGNIDANNMDAKQMTSEYFNVRPKNNPTGGVQFGEFVVNVNNVTDPSNVFAGTTVRLQSDPGPTFIGMVANSYAPEYSGVLTPMIIGGGNNQNNSDTAIAFPTGSLMEVWKTTNFKYGANITGSLIQSSSNSLVVDPIGQGVGTWIRNRVNISDIPGGAPPRLFISGSDGAFTEYGRGFINQDTTKVNGLGSSVYTGAHTSSAASNTVAVYNADFSTDVELQMFANSGGIGFSDWDNGTAFNYIPFMTVAPNNGDNPSPTMTRGLIITGSTFINNLQNGITDVVVTYNTTTGELRKANLPDILSASFDAAEFWSTRTQSGSAGVSGSLTLNNSGSVAGISVQNNSRITLSQGGTYNIQFSAQVETSAGADTLYVWFKKNGVNIGDSASKVVLPNNTAQIMTVNIFDIGVANDYYEIAYQNLNGHARVLYEAASGNIPAIPSVIVTVNQIK